jgi:hypothetical protein
MRPILVAALWLLIPQLGYAQTFDVLEFTEEVESGRSLWSTTYDQTDFYLPDGPGPHPVLVFHQGAQVDKSYYSSFARLLAAAGVIVAIPNHRSLFGANYSEQKVLNSTWEYLLEKNDDPDSSFFRLVDRHSLFAMGHSFGGVSAYGAAQGRCVAPVCFGGPRPPEALLGVLLWGSFYSGDIANIVPMMHLQGSIDNLAEARSSFERIQNSPKILVVVDGANHYGITDVNNPDGAKADEAEPEVGQEVSIAAIAAWALRFIWPVYLFGDIEEFWLCSTGSCGDRRLTVETSF